MKQIVSVLIVLGSALCGAENLDLWDTKPLGPAVKVPAVPKSRIMRKAVSNRKFRKLSGPELIFAPGKTVIVTGKEEEERIAAKLLSCKVKAACGSALPVFEENKVEILRKGDRFTVSAGQKSFETVIFIGGKTAPAEPSMPEQGFRIRCTGNAMLISGNDTGSSHAVVDFLEQYGFRSLWPGESGQVVPKLSAFKVTPFELSDHPAMLQRGMRCEPKYTPAKWKLSEKEKRFFTPEEYGPVMCATERTLLGLHALQLPPRYFAAVPKERSEWALWQRIGNGKHKIAAGHSYKNWWKKYGKEHPEYFALLKNGSRHPQPEKEPEREQLCFSNPDVIRAIAAERVERLKTQERRYVSIAPNDGGRGNAPCMCLRCRRLDPPNGSPILLPTRDRYVSLSDRYFGSFNKITAEILKKCPDAKVGVLAYSWYAAAPLQVKIHPKLIVGFVGFSYANTSYLERSRENWARWAGAAEQLFWRPNLFYPTHGVMTNFARDVAKDIRYMYSTGMIGTDIDTFGSDWSTMGLSYYVTARMLWDPSLSADEMIEDYCEKGFGPAASSIKVYFNLLESLTRRNADSAAAAARLQSVNDADNDDPAQTIYCLSWAKFGRGYTEADFDDLQTLLTEAKEAAKNDPAVLKRVGFLQTGLDFTRARIRLYNLCYGRARGTKPEIQAAAQKQYDIMVKAGMTTPHALSVGHIAWWDRNCWGKCGWKPDPAKMPRDPGARTTKKRGGSRKVWN